MMGTNSYFLLPRFRFTFYLHKPTSQSTTKFIPFTVMLRRSLTRIGNFSPVIKTTLYIPKQFCASAFNGMPIDKALRNDVKMLGNNLGEVIKAEREDVFLAVEKLRKLGRDVSKSNY